MAIVADLSPHQGSNEDKTLRYTEGLKYSDIIKAVSEPKRY